MTVARVLDVDHAEMARRPEQALRGLGVLDGDDAVGDLDQRAGEMTRLDAIGREGGQIFAGAAEIEQEIDADIVAEERKQPDGGPVALLVATATARPGKRRVNLIQDLHQHAGHGHQDEIAIDDMAELVRDHGALLVLGQELEDALGDHDPGVGAQQAVGKGGRVAVGDEADLRRREAIVAGDLMDELVDAGITLLDRGVVEEFELIEPAQRQVGQPRADQPDHQIDDHGQHDGDGQIYLA
jgi:hypothetical protein